MIHLRLFSVLKNSYIYAQYLSEKSSVIKTKIRLLFTPFISFIFSILFFNMFLTKTSYIPTLNYKISKKKKKRYISFSLFS